MLRGFADWGHAGAWQGQDQGASAVLLSAQRGDCCHLLREVPHRCLASSES